MSVYEKRADTPEPADLGFSTVSTSLGCIAVFSPSRQGRSSRVLV
jgi:hypothetical protein